MSGEFSPSPPEYRVEVVPRLQEGALPSDSAEQAMAVLRHSWSARGAHRDDTDRTLWEMFSGDGVTLVALDVGDVVVATATYKPDTRTPALPGWAILQGVAELPEINGDESGEEQRDAVLDGIEALARANGMTRLIAEYLMDLTREQIEYYARRGYMPVGQSATRYAELYLELQEPEDDD